MLIILQMYLIREEQSFTNLVLVNLSITLVQIYKPEFLTYWEMYVFHLSLNLSEFVVLNTLELSGKPQSCKCLYTSLISTLCSDIHAITERAQTRTGQ